MMIKYKIFVFLVFVIASCHLTAATTQKMAKSDFKLKLTNFICHADNDFIINATCFIKAARNKAGYLTMKTFIRKPLLDFIVELRHFFKPIIGRNPQYRPYLYNIDINW